MKDLTHLEDPWKLARKGIDDKDVSRNVMEDNLIMEYFFWMDKIYNLKSPEGVEDYIRDMKKRIS